MTFKNNVKRREISESNNTTVVFFNWHNGSWGWGWGRGIGTTKENELLTGV